MINVRLVSTYPHNVGVLMVTVGMAGIIVGAVAVVRPMRQVPISTRQRAFVVIGVSLTVLLVGTTLLADGDDERVVGSVDEIGPSAPSGEFATSTAAESGRTTNGGNQVTSTSPRFIPPISPESISTTTLPGKSTGSDEPTALQVLLTIPIELETPSGYSRDLFPHWTDVDADGCDTRAEVLIRDAHGTARSESGCRISNGSWYSFYDGVWLDVATQVQVDHVVALKEAWDSGAKLWDLQRRKAFANDLDSLELIAVSSSSNHSKGDADPSNWLPPNKADVCRYIVAVVAVKSTWGLSMDQSEHGRIRNLLELECAGAVLLDAIPVPPLRPMVTPTTPTPTTVVAGRSSVVIADIVYDAPGNDVEYNNSEYLILRNDGPGTAKVGGWRIVDAKDHWITIPPPYSIAPGGTLKIYTGAGVNSTDRFFAGFAQAIWNNSGGDTATLYDDTDSIVATYSYSS